MVLEDRYLCFFSFIRLKLVLKAMTFVFVFLCALPSSAKEEDHSQDVIIGERLFKGLIPLGNEAATCISCHTFYTSDSLDWNPLATEIAAKSLLMDSLAFAESLLKPSGVKMAEVHKNFKVDAIQVNQLHKYLINLNEVGVNKRPPSINKILVVGFLILVILGALSDLVVTKKIPYKPIHIILILVAGAFILKTFAHEAIDLGRSKNYEPDQPIKFSHRLHTKDNNIDCFYCHTNADEGKTAGLPSADVCMNCHVIVREGSNSGKFEISKLIDHVEKEKEIEWIRVHSLPDHVYFNHEQHVKVGGVSCNECHGVVEEMDRVKQVNDLSMGWCLDCHKTRKVDFRNNEYYQTFEKYHQSIAKGDIDSVLVTDIGGNDCMKCHY